MTLNEGLGHSNQNQTVEFRDLSHHKGLKDSSNTPEHRPAFQVFLIKSPKTGSLS